MRLGLDLDGTLLIEATPFPLEPSGLLRRLTAVEPLRMGTRERPAV